MEWRSLDHIALQESYWPVSSDWDFFHINSVDFDRDGSLLVSARSTHTVYKLARSGEILWRLGGTRSDFELGPGASFAWQHDARRRTDGAISIFDNGATPAVEARSRALILELDEDAMTATLQEQYSHRGVLAGSQGNVQLLDSGNVFVGWGEVPRVSEFERSGRMVFDALLGSGYECYRAFRLPWSATPAHAPALALARDGARVAAYASWNGATRVAHWQLLAGVSAAALAPVARASARSFETALQARSAGPLFAVQALGSTASRSAAPPSWPPEPSDASAELRSVRGDPRARRRAGGRCQPSTSSAALLSVAASPEISSVVTIDSRHFCRSSRIFAAGPISDSCSISAVGIFAPASCFLPPRYSSWISPTSFSYPIRIGTFAWKFAPFAPMPPKYSA